MDELVRRSVPFAAKWICLEVRDQTKNALYWFRKEFDVADPAKTTIRISADTRYRLYINGKYVGYGPLQSQPYCKSFDTYDLSDVLVAGKNCIAVEVNYLGVQPFAAPGLLAQIDNARGEMICGTDHTFRCVRSPAWDSRTLEWNLSKYRRFQEKYDARKDPKGWREVGFDDAEWKLCAVYRGYSTAEVPQAGIWCNMIPRDIPYMDESTTVYAKEVAKVQEHLDVADRLSGPLCGTNLAESLSRHGKPLTYTHVEGADALCAEEGETFLACSDNHQLDHDFDGVYSPSVLLDFGTEINAFPVLVVEGEAGARIDMGFTERLVDGEFYIANECGFANSYTLRGGEEEVYVPFAWQSFRYVRIQLHNACRGVRIKRFGAKITRYPYEYKGAFASSDPKYDRLFDICRHTIELCSNECLMDTPFREQGQYLGDVSAVTLGGIYACFGNTELPSKYIWQTASNQSCAGQFPPTTNFAANAISFSWTEYDLEYVIAVWEHYVYTGDEIWIHRLYPQLTRVMEYFMTYLGDDGLVGVTPTPPFIDWSYVDKRGPSAAVNAIFYGALEAMIRIAEIKHDTYMVHVYRELRAGIKAAFAKTFYDGERRVVVDCHVHGVKSEHVNECSTAAALWYGLLEEDEVRDAIRALYEEKTVAYTRSEPFFTWFVLRALVKYGRTDLAMRIVDSRYVKLMVDRGMTGTTEEWGVNGSWRKGDTFSTMMRTMSHAWSACPAQFFLQTIPGIEILEPGGRRVRVDPKPVDYEYDITYPLCAGSIRVVYRDGKATVTSTPGVTLEQ